MLSCQTPRKARWHSIFAGVLTILLTAPPILLGMAAFVYQDWPQQDPHQDAAYALPLLLRWLTPGWVSILGLAAIVGAVTSSFSASILSAGAMFSWNVFRPLMAADASVAQMKRVIRGSIVLLGGGAVVLALGVGSVKDLWFFCADLVFVLLFPQLVMALYDARANRIGSMTAFIVSLILRLGGGEPIFGLPAFISYPEIFQSWLSGQPADWYGPHGEMLFPYRVTAALVGVALLPMVSRLTARWDPSRTVMGDQGLGIRKPEPGSLIPDP